MTFTGEEMSLDIPESEVLLESGWNIIPLHFKVAMCKMIYKYIYIYIVLFLLRHHYIKTSVIL